MADDTIMPDQTPADDDMDMEDDEKTDKDTDEGTGDDSEEV